MRKFRSIIFIVFALIAACGTPTTKAESPTLATEVRTKIAVEPSPTKEEPVYAPGSIPVIEQTYDIATTRGEEPWDMALSPDDTRAYVTGSETDNLFVIDLETRQIIDIVDLWPAAEYPLGPAPRSIDITPDGSRLVLGAVNDRSVLLFDTETHSVIKRLALGSAPTDVAISPKGTFAYVPLHGSDTLITVVDMVAEEILTTIDVNSICPDPFPGAFTSVAFSPDGSRAYVADNGGLVVIDATTHSVIDRVRMPFGDTKDMAISADGTAAFVTSIDPGWVSAVDLVNGRLTATHYIFLANGVEISADGNLIYVTTFGFMEHAPYNVMILDAHTGEQILGMKYKHPAPYGRQISDIKSPTLSHDGETLYLPTIDGDGLVIADPDTLEAEGIILLNALAQILPSISVISPDGTYLYVTGRARSPNTVSVIDLSKYELAGEITVDESTQRCKSPGKGLDISPDGSKIYMLSHGDKYLMIADTETRVIEEIMKLPEASFLSQIAVHPEEDIAYIVDEDGIVFVVDLLNLEVINTIPTEIPNVAAIKLAPDAGRAYITGDYGYAVLNLVTETLVTSVKYGREGEWSSCARAIAFLPNQSQYMISDHHGIYLYDMQSDEELRYIDLMEIAYPILALTPDITVTLDEKTAYLAEWDEKAVVALDPITWEIKALIDTGRMPFSCLTPRWLTFNPDESELYVVCEEADRVLVIDTADNEVTGVIRLDE